MNGENTKKYSADELRALRKAGASRTDSARLRAMSDTDVERAATADPDWEGVPADWHEKAETITPRPKVPVSIRLDADLVDNFRDTGPGWQTRINAVLRAYINAKVPPAG